MKRYILLVFLLLYPLAIVQGNEIIEDDFLDEDLFSEYDEQGPELQTVPDPLYYLNKGVYYFNDTFYTYLLAPVARRYAKVVPRPARSGMANFFHNLAFPIRFVNNLLQFKFVEVGQETALFLFNTTHGLGFLRGGQEVFGFETSNEDLGQTLGSYSIGEGIYLVLPFFGPSNIRDLIGIAGDTFLTPLNYAQPVWLGPAASAQTTVNYTSLNINAYNDIKDISIDPYTAIKDGYLKARQMKIDK